MFRRHALPRLQAALGDTPVVFVQGPRQAGKTTLVRDLLGEDRTYLTLDDLSVLTAAQADPAGFVAGLPERVVLDEVQHAPDLLPAIKADVDRKRRPGRYLLTGSADALLVPRLSKALVGRMELLTLHPLAQAEIEDSPGDFVDVLFDRGIATIAGGATPDLRHRILLGGYPEPASRPAAERRAAWLDAYLATIVHRDVPDLARIDSLADLPRLLGLLAARSSSVLNLSELARSAALPQTTLKRYVALLQATFLVHLVPAWSANASKRHVRASKALVGDTGLMARLLGLASDAEAPDATSHWGPLLETFVGNELRRLASWSRTQPTLHHFRTHAGAEVDFVLEDQSGRLVGIEVKSGATVAPRALHGLTVLKEAASKRFLRGIVLYQGTDVVPFARDLHAVPIRALWGGGAA